MPLCPLLTLLQRVRDEILDVQQRNGAKVGAL